MKYVIVIPDGCADEPQDSLGGKTPLQAARTPAMDRAAQMGQVGASNNVPQPLTPASDVATLSLFGYDPLEVYTGRAPLETVAMGIQLKPGDWAIRCNLVHVADGLMKDFTAGHISSEDGKALIHALEASLGGEVKSETGEIMGRLEFFPGVSYRNILVYRANRPVPFTKETRTQPPHDIPDQPVLGHLPTGPGNVLLRNLMEKSKPIFHCHPANQARISQGKTPATQCWLWGQGSAPILKNFKDLHSIQGAIISAVDLVRGVGMLIGWNRIDVPTATGYLDTDYAAKAKYMIEALKNHDLVCVHVEAPDEASHEGRVDAKVKSLEEIDRHIVGPALEELPKFGDWRILVSPDHQTHLRTRAHSYGHVPFVMAGTGIPSFGQSTYDEAVAAASSLSFDKGHHLINRFLK
ncbi:MAG: cofactor-independent phosphoglycerate mutase [Gemmataceae bacterium]|nr:cofactor-independent phosphoglycerate mutase [Gemmataceae bacterium]